jgi:hypothetical protein
MNRIMDSLTVPEEATYIVSNRGGINCDQSSVIEQLKICREKTDAISKEMRNIDSDYLKEIFLLRSFICYCMPTSLMRAVAAKHFFRQRFSYDGYWLPYLEHFSLFFLIAFPIASFLYIFESGIYMDPNLNSKWLISIAVSIAIDFLALKPIKIFVTWIAGASIVDEEVRACLGILRMRSTNILKRSSGSMLFADSLIQHYNPACRAARNFPHLPISRLLMSLNDDDIPFQIWVSKSYAWRRIEKYLFYSFCYLVPACPLFLQDSFNEIIVTVIFASIVVFGVYGASTPAYTQYFYQYYLPCVCAIAFLVLLRIIFFKRFTPSFNSFTAPISKDIEPVDTDFLELSNIYIDNVDKVKALMPVKFSSSFHNNFKTS